MKQASEPTSGPTRRAPLRVLGEIVLAGASYYGLAELGLELAVVEGTVTPLWPATGVALVGFLLFGPWVSLGVAAAAFAANLPMVGANAAGGIAAGNTLAPLVAWLLLRAVGFRPKLDRTRDALALVGIGALGSMVISASVGTGVLVAADLIESERFLGTWSVWWAGDAMGVLAVAPVLLMIYSMERLARPRLARVFEAVLLAGALAGVSVLLLSTSQPTWVLVFPVLGWAAWRFQQRAAAPAALTVISVASFAAAEDLGSFGGGTLLTTMVGLQVFNAAAAFTSFFFAAIVAERERTRGKLEHAAIELEEAVRRRTAELQATNVRLEREIAERAGAVAALQRQEAQLEEAQAVAHIGSWDWDIPTNTITWSAELYRIYGVDPASFRATYEAYLALVHPDDRARADGVVRRAMRDAAPFDFHHRIVRPDGEIRVMSSRGRVIVGEDGRPLRMTGVGQDITERHEAELALRESEELFRAVFEAASIGIVQADLEGVIQRLNPAFEELAGRPRAELRGMRLADLVAVPDRARFADLLERMKGGAIGTFEVEQRLAGPGEGTWVHAILTRVGRDDGGFIQAVISDLSARRRAEELHEAEEGRERLGMYFARVPAAVCVTRGPDHVVDFANHPFLALDPGDGRVVGEPVREAFPALARQGILERVDAVLETNESGSLTELAVRVGSETRYLTFAFQPLVGADGVEGVMIHGSDVTDVVRARMQSAESLALLDTLLASAPAAFAVFDQGERFVRVNERFASLSGLPIDAHPGRTVREAIPSLASRVGPLLDAVLSKGRAVSDVEIGGRVGPTGEIRTWSASFYPIRTADGALLGAGCVMVDITDRKRSESMLVTQREALELAARETDIATLLTALAAIAERRSRDDVLAMITEVDGDGRLATVAAPHLPPAFVSAIDGLRLDAAGCSPQAAAATRSPAIVGDVATHPSWSPLRHVALGHGVRAVWSQPIVSTNGHVLGTFSLCCTSARNPAPHELEVLGVLGQVAAIAMERDRSEADRKRLLERERRAQLEFYEREHRIAETLQRSMLPEAFPLAPEVDVAARYVPAAGQAEVGGDWYDLFSLPDGRLGIVIGDVVGHGVVAAAAMGQVRVAVRAYGMELVPPAETLGRLNRLLQEFQPGSMATLIYAHLDPDTGVMRVARAGHPPPLLLDAAGGSRFLEDRSAPPIGAAASIAYEESTLRLEPGQTLLLYTDGLIERRDEPLDAGMARLARLVSDAPDDLESICDRCVQALVSEEGPADDVALLAVRLVGQAGMPLRLELPARPTHLPRIRRVFSRWLDRNGMGAEAASEATLAATEACANAMKHAYDGGEGMLRLDASFDAGELIVTVRDSGSWKPAGEADDEGGRGMRLMRELMDQVEVSATSEGTVVRMRRRAGDRVEHG